MEMGKVEILKNELESVKTECKILQQKCFDNQTHLYIANAKRIRAEKEVAKLRMELALLKEGILV